jgi:cytidylate kinase-like protein
VCISHATGARGNDVGRLVAEMLAVRYADDEVIAEASEWAQLDPSLVADAERRKPFVARLLGNVGARDAPRLPTGEAGARRVPSDGDVRALIVGAVSSLARAGDVVIVAHAASFALEPGDALRVLVTASPAVRSERLAAERSLSAGDAEKAIREEDAGRADYLKRFYGVERELPTHYDLVVNTDALEPDAAAAVVVAAASR